MGCWSRLYAVENMRKVMKRLKDCYKRIETWLHNVQGSKFDSTQVFSAIQTTTSWVFYMSENKPGCQCHLWYAFPSLSHSLRGLHMLVCLCLTTKLLFFLFLLCVSRSHLVKMTSLPNNQCCAPSAENINTCDFDFIDPAILAVRGDKATYGLNNSGLEMRPTSTPQLTYEDEARLWLLMQQSASAHQDPKFSLIFMQDSSFAHQELRFSGHIGNGFSPMGDTYGISSRLMDQHQTYNPSPLTQLSQQKYGNGQISNCYWPGLDAFRLGSEVGMTEIQRNEILGLNKLFPGYGDLML